MCEDCRQWCRRVSVVVLTGTLSTCPFKGSISSSITELAIFACQINNISQSVTNIGGCKLEHWRCLSDWQLILLQQRPCKTLTIVMADLGQCWNHHSNHKKWHKLHCPCINAMNVQYDSFTLTLHMTLIKEDVYNVLRFLRQRYIKRDYGILALLFCITWFPWMDIDFWSRLFWDSVEG